MGTIPLALLHLDQVQDYIDARLAEGAARETVHRELVVLRKALKLAIRRGHTGPNADQVMPEFTRHYVPRMRWLSPEQVDALHAQLEPKRRLWLITAVYLGPRLGELQRLHRVKNIRCIGCTATGAMLALHQVRKKRIRWFV